LPRPPSPSPNSLLPPFPLTPSRYKWRCVPLTRVNGSTKNSCPPQPPSFPAIHAPLTREHIIFRTEQIRVFLKTVTLAFWPTPASPAVFVSIRMLLIPQPPDPQHHAPGPPPLVSRPSFGPSRVERKYPPPDHACRPLFCQTPGIHLL